MRVIRTLLVSLLAAPAALAQGWVVGPSRQDLTVRPGGTSTFLVRVEREPGAGHDNEKVRFTAAPGDWDISRGGEVQLLPPESSRESATGWMTFTPASFVLSPGGIGNVRVSVTVPKETAPGVYRTGIFFEEHSVVPDPGQGTKRMVLRYRLSSLIYVVVPETARKFATRDVALRPANGGWEIGATLENQGGVHLRPAHWVEVKNAAGETVFRTEPMPTMVLLPGRELEVKLMMPKDFAPVAGTQVRYVVDCGKELPLQAITISLAGNE